MTLKQRREIKKMQKEELKRIVQKVPHDENDNIVLRLWPKEVEKSFYIDGDDDTVSLTSEFKQYLNDFRDNFANTDVVVNLDKKTKPSSKEKFEKLYKSYFRYNILKLEKDLKKNLIACICCLVLGLITIAIEVTLDLISKGKYWNFIDIIPEILAWVFTWECFDLFFFQRPKMRTTQKKNYRMYKAEFVEKELQVNIKEINYQQKEIQPTAESAQNANAAPSTTPSAKPEEKKAEPANKVEVDKKSEPVKKVEDKKPTEENKDKK